MGGSIGSPLICLIFFHQALSFLSGGTPGRHSERQIPFWPAGWLVRAVLLQAGSLLQLKGSGHNTDGTSRITIQREALTHPEAQALPLEWPIWLSLSLLPNA